MSERKPFGSSRWALAVAAILLVPLGLWAAGLIGEGHGEGRDDAPGPVDAVSTLAPEPTPAPLDTGAFGVERSDPAAIIASDAPPEVAASLARADAGDLASLGVIVTGGRTFVLGAVPERTDAQHIVSVAAALTGEGQVSDFMVIDQRAPRPDRLDVRLDDAAAWNDQAADLDDDIATLADALAALLAAGDVTEVTVVGHLPAAADDLAALDASRRRAERFAEAVIDAGATRTSVIAVGRGGSAPLLDSDDEPERNRRIDLVLGL